MTTPTIQFRTRTILYCAGVMALSFGFVFLAMMAEEQKIRLDEKINQEIVKW